MAKTLDEKKKDILDFKTNLLTLDDFAKAILNSKLKFLEELKEIGALNPNFRMPQKQAIEATRTINSI